MDISPPHTPSSPPPQWRTVLINLVLFQCAWFACVLGGAQGHPWVGPVVVTGVAGYHLARARRPWREAALLSFAALIGAVWDGQLAGQGWLVFASGEFARWLAPSWIIAMWVSFATTLNVTLRWLRGRYSQALGFGAVGGPLAYFAGERLGGVTVPDPWVGFAAVAVGWALISPILVWLAARWDGFPDPADGAEPSIRRN